MTEDPYELIDAPQFADLTDVASTTTMSPGTSAWFPQHARESVVSPLSAAAADPPPPPPPSAPEQNVAADLAAVAPTPNLAISGGAVRVPSVASKPTKSSAAMALPVKPVPAAAAAAASSSEKPAAPTKPVAPSLSTTARVRGVGPPKATTEELEMLAAAREMRANKLKRDKWRTQLDKVLSETGSALPARSTQALTVPVEFALHSSGSGSRSVPTSPRSESGKGGAPSSSSKPFAEQVHEFTKTPKRFRGKGPLEPPSPAPSPRPTALTKTNSFHLLSDSRAGVRPAVKSTAEREAEFLASLPKFKARPVSRKVLDSAGDLGVPRVEKREPTQPTEFNLSASMHKEKKPVDDDAASDAGSTHSAPASFKARPYNRQLMEGKLAGLAQVTPRKTTLAKSPKLSTSNRADVRAPVEAAAAPPAAAEQFASFKARPMPNMGLGPSPLKSPVEQRSLTEPKPFKLSSVARHEVFKDITQRALAQQEQEAAKARQFKAMPMPIADQVWKPQTDGKVCARAGPSAAA